MLALFLLAALPFQSEPAPAAETDEIVVTAVKDKCKVKFADRVLSDREFDQRAELWAAGRPVRVVAPRGQNYQCLAKIAFRLQDKGVRLIEWVDPPAPAE